MMRINIPAINSLTSVDATAIRQITMALILEIEKLNKKIDEADERNKKASENRKVTKYGV